MGEGIGASKRKWASRSSAHRRGTRGGVNPHFLWDLKPLLIPLTTEGAVRRACFAPQRPLPAALYSQPSLTSSRGPRPKQSPQTKPAASAAPGSRTSTFLRPQSPASAPPPATAPTMISLPLANGVRPQLEAALRSRGGGGESLRADAILFPEQRLQAREGRLRRRFWWP